MDLYRLAGLHAHVAGETEHLAVKPKHRIVPRRCRRIAVSSSFSCSWLDSRSSLVGCSMQVTMSRAARSAEDIDDSAAALSPLDCCSPCKQFATGALETTFSSAWPRAVSIQASVALCALIGAPWRGGLLGVQHPTATFFVPHVAVALARLDIGCLSLASAHASRSFIELHNAELVL